MADIDTRADAAAKKPLNSFDAYGMGAAARKNEDDLILEVKDLSVTLFTEDGPLPALSDVTFRMRRAETLAVVGESGCGKSMTALSIMGLLPQPPARIVGGSIDFEGTDLAKLSKDLNCYDPDNAAYMDYYERLLYNQLVGSINPQHYATLYQYAVGLNASKPWGNETPQSTCCGGTGAENHVKYQEAAYFVSDNTLWVALYLPSTAQWDDKKLTISQQCQWPAEKSTIRIAKGKGQFTMKLRVPYWATEGFSVKLNGQEMAQGCRPGSYVEIPTRKWTTKDVVEVTMPFTAHMDFGPDKMQIAATGKNENRTEFEPLWAGTFMYGPLVMATTGISSWNDATLQLDPSLSGVQLLGAKDERSGAAYSNVYSLQYGGHTFIPDYYADRHCTHYFRFQLPGTPEPVAGADGEGGADISALRETMVEAKSRRNAQQRWNDIEVKVPEYAPWAKHGYRRMMEQMRAAEAVLDNPDLNADQAAIDKATANLNAALNTMRPGNLPELEDMDELLPLLEKARDGIAGRTGTIVEA